MKRKLAIIVLATIIGLALIVLLPMPAFSQYWYPIYNGYPVYGGYPVYRPRVVVVPPPPPPVVVVPPPPPPVVVVPPPPPPVVVVPPPPPPVVVAPSRNYFWSNGRRCWMQYAGLDNYGQPMYIQACE